MFIFSSSSAVIDESDFESDDDDESDEDDDDDDGGDGFWISKTFTSLVDKQKRPWYTWLNYDLINLGIMNNKTMKLKRLFGTRAVWDELQILDQALSNETNKVRRSDRTNRPSEKMKL